MESPIQPIFFDILLHEIDQVGHREKDATSPLHDRGDPKANRQMRFADTGPAQ